MYEATNLLVDEFPCADVAAIRYRIVQVQGEVNVDGFCKQADVLGRLLQGHWNSHCAPIRISQDRLASGFGSFA